MALPIQIVERFPFMTYGGSMAASKAARLRLSELVATGYVVHLATWRDSQAGDQWLLRAHLRDDVPFTVFGTELSKELLRREFRRSGG